MHSDNERKIFKYNTGSKEVFADPLALERKISVRLDDNTNETLKKMEKKEAVHPQAESAAIEKLIQVVRQVFSMEPFDPSTGKGALDAECLLVWNNWCDFISEKKNPSDVTPSSSPPSAGPQAA